MNATDISTVKVDTTQLRQVAESTFKRIETYRSSVQAIAKLVDSSADSWKGEAAEAYRSVFKQEYDRAMAVLDEFISVPQALCDYAGIYSEVMARTTEQASSVSEFSME